LAGGRTFDVDRVPPAGAVWLRKAPDGFLFAVKASCYLTHMKKLKDPEELLQRLLHNARGLGKTFGPVLFQFPRA